MKQNTKKYGRKLGVLILTAMVVMALPIGFGAITDNEQVEQANPVQNAEAVAPIVAGGAIVAASVVAGGVIQHKTTDYFTEAEIDDATDEVMQESVHDSAITSEGTNDGFLDNVDNDLNTIEGSLEQRINTALIRDGDELNSESETVNLAEDEASEYLWVTQTNLLETHNFHALSVQTYMEKLDEAEASDDYGTTEIIEIEDEEDWNDLEYIPQGTSAIVELQNDITISSRPVFPADVDLHIDGNGYEIDDSETTNTLVLGDRNEVELNNIKFEDMAQILDPEYGYLNVIDSDIDEIDANNNLDMYQQNSTIGTTDSEVNEVDSRLDVRAINKDANLTLDPEEVADSDLEATASIENEDEEVVEMTAVEVNVDPAYSDSEDDTVEVAVPYNADTGEPVTANGENLSIKTTTSGVANYAIPVDFVRGVELVEHRDDLSGDAYTFVGDYASGVWTDTLQEIASDEERSVYDEDGVHEDLGTFVPPAIDADNPEGVVAYYAGTYESVYNVAGTDLTLTDDNDTYEDAVIFSTDMQVLADQTDNVDVLAEGDEFSVDGDNAPNRTLIVDTSTGEVHDLEGTVTVDDVQVADDEEATEQDIRTFDLESTDLSDQAERLQENVDVTVEVADYEGDGGAGIGFPDLDSTEWLIILVLAGGAVVLLARD